MGRRKLTKNERQQIYSKFNGRCAYCGCGLAYKDMQVDHVDSVYRFGELRGQDVDFMDNYFPACRMCNFYKSTMTVEEFRKQLGELTGRLEKTFIYRLAKKYGVVQENQKKIKFYFEMDREMLEGGTGEWLN